MFGGLINRATRTPTARVAGRGPGTSGSSGGSIAGRPLSGRVTVNTGRVAEGPNSVAPILECKPSEMAQKLAQSDEKFTREEKNSILRRMLENEINLPTLVFERSIISLYSKAEVMAYAVVEITNADMEPRAGSINDPKMGVPGGGSKCRSCPDPACTGHYGYMLVHDENNPRSKPVLHPLVLRQIVMVLNSVCSSCGALLKSEKSLAEMGVLRYREDNRLAEIEKVSKKAICSRVHEPLAGGEIIKCSQNPIYKLNKIIQHKIQRVNDDTEAKDDAPNGKSDNYIETLEVLKIFNMISDEDAATMGFQYPSHPRNMIIEALMVIPPTLRPPKEDNSGVHPNDLTVAYANIMKAIINERSSNPKKDSEADLFNEIRRLMDNKDGRHQSQGREFISLMQRVQGKKAIIRANMMGKRVNDCGRTVLSPDPTLRFGEISIPERMASTLTVEVKIFSLTQLPYLNKLLKEGKISSITKANLLGRRQVNPKNTYTLEVGDTVERWLENGDYVAFNRNPSLHKQSMMVARAVLRPQLTIGIHLSYSSPLGADKIY